MDRHVADSVTAPATSPGALRMPTLATGAAFLACYVLLDATSVIFPRATFGITPWNPSTGLAWAFILLFGKRYLPLLFFAPFLADVLVFGSTLPWWIKLLTAAIVGSGYAAALLVLLHPKVRFDPALATMRDMVLLMGIAVVATGLVALAYVALIVATGDLPTSEFQWSLLRFWIGDLIGIAVVTPFLLICAAQAKLPRLSLETALQGLAILLALFAIFGLVGGANLRLFYVLFLPIIWMGLREGLEGVTLGLVLTQIGLIVGLLLTQEETASVTSLQARMLILALTGLAIGVVVSERRRAERQLWLNQEAVSRISRLGSMGEFATVIAHEVNQPLTAISNYTRLVKRYLETETGNKSAAIEAAGKAVAQVERTAAIIKSLRDLIRLGRSEIGPQSVQRIVRETVEMLEPTPAARHHRAQDAHPQGSAARPRRPSPGRAGALEPRLERHRGDRWNPPQARHRHHHRGHGASGARRDQRERYRPRLRSRLQGRPRGACALHQARRPRPRPGAEPLHHRGPRRKTRDRRRQERRRRPLHPANG